jgi:hypothetical protein
VLSGFFQEIAATADGTFHEARYAYDERGNIAQRRFLDCSGAAALGPNGFSIEDIDYDPLGRPVHFRPRRPGDDGTALSVAIRYDARGNAVAVEYLDRVGRPTNGVQGFAKAELAYNRFGDVVGVQFFTADGKPIGA